MPVTAQSLPVELIPAPILMLDETGRLAQWSAAAAELFSLSAQATDQPATLIVPRGSLPHWNMALAAARDRGQWSGELKLQTTRGAELRIEARITADASNGWIVGAANLTPRVRDEIAARRVWQRRAAERLAVAAAAEQRASSNSRSAARQLDFLTLADETETDTGEPAPALLESVLVIGGGPMARECLRLLLEARGFSVSTATDGYDAVEQLESSRGGVQAAVIDADLPGWGAAAAVEALRRREPFLPVVVLGSLEGKRLDAKVQAVVPKPFRLDDVLWGLGECRRSTS